MTNKRVFLGETIINVKNVDCPFRFFTPSDWVLYWIEKYGSINGSHHKAWLIDQIARILNGCAITVKIAKWDDGVQEYRVSIDGENEKYKNWVISVKSGIDGPDTFDYETGIAP